MMEGRKKIFVFLSIVVLFVLAFILIYLFFNKSAPAAPLENAPATTTLSTAPVETAPIVAPVKNIPASPPQNSEEREKLYVKQLSRTFVERFETYSNQNQNRNIDDASALATDHMSGYIASKSQTQGLVYQGVTTKVISMDVTAFSADSATVRVGAQLESDTATSSVASYKNGRVELKKIDGMWKVDGLFWDPA